MTTFSLAVWRTLPVWAVVICAWLYPAMATAAVTPTPRSGDAQWPLVWLDADNDCQNTATEVLIRDAAGLVKWAGPDACVILRGTWRSRGTGEPLNFERAWVVPVVTPAQAVRRGALLWNRDQQIAFLNDLDNLMVLDPVTAQERGMNDIGGWLPAPEYLCEYASQWQRVARRYGLQLSADDRSLLAQWRARCPQ